MTSLGFVLILVNALWACPSYTPSYGIASNSIVPFLTVATCITLFSAYSPFAALLTIILAFPATVSGFTVIVFPSIDAVAMFEASELTVSSPLDVLFVTSNVPQRQKRPSSERTALCCTLFIPTTTAVR